MIGKMIVMEMGVLGRKIEMKLLSTYSRGHRIMSYLLEVDLILTFHRVPHTCGRGEITLDLLGGV